MVMLVDCRNYSFKKVQAEGILLVHMRWYQFLVNRAEQAILFLTGFVYAKATLYVLFVMLSSADDEIAASVGALTNSLSQLIQLPLRRWWNRSQKGIRVRRVHVNYATCSLFCLVGTSFDFVLDEFWKREGKRNMFTFWPKLLYICT